VTAPAAQLDWVLFEALGHRAHYGRISEVPYAGATLIKVDVFDGDNPEPAQSHLYAAGAVYAITPTAEAKCREAGAALFAVQRSIERAHAGELPAGEGEPF
jgi:hypothetical protein